MANSHLIHHLISQVFCMLFKASKDSRYDWKRWTIALKKKKKGLDKADLLIMTTSIYDRGRGEG